MKAQNLILKCNANQIPTDNEFREFVFEQLDQANVDFCGNPATIQKEELNDKNALLLNFHFKSPYEVDEETAIEMITWAFYKEQIEKIKTGKHEIEIFLS